MAWGASQVPEAPAVKVSVAVEPAAPWPACTVTASRWAAGTVTVRVAVWTGSVASSTL